jgi:hypothetical protein
MSGMGERREWPRARVLLDMHVPDWDPAFLARFEPADFVGRFAEAGAGEVTFYAQSHIGLCYWPTGTGPVHPAMGDRDFVGAMLREIHDNGMAARAYYSVVQNNWAYERHPDWRTTVPLRQDGGYPGPRYGLCCPNNPAYRDFVRRQTTDLVARYQFEAIFFDLTYLTPVCACRACQDRFEAELGIRPTTTVDWRSPGWSALRGAAERWAVELAAELKRTVQDLRPEVLVQHNFTALGGLAFGCPLEALATTDLPSADFYGDLAEQLAVARLFASLEPGKPCEFMTSITTHVLDPVTVKDRADLEVAAGLARATGSALTMIDAVRPDGTVPLAPYERVEAAFALLGDRLPAEARPAADVGVYFSEHARIDPADNGREASEVVWGGLSYPHFVAFKGACLALQSAGVPYDVVTSADLDVLDRFAVLVLPDAVRISQAEASALDAWVRSGGRLYASTRAGMLLTSSPGAERWALSETLGIRSVEPGSMASAGAVALDGVTTFAGTKPVYLRPVEGGLRSALAPQDRLLVPATRMPLGGVHAVEGSSALAEIDLPWSDRWGSVFDHAWSSVHSDPPWRMGVAAAIVEHRHGQGRTVYSVLDIESDGGGAAQALFVALVRRLLEGRASWSVEAPAGVWAFVHAVGGGAGRAVTLLDVNPAPTDRRSSDVLVRLPGRWRLAEAPAGSAWQVAAGSERTELRLELRERVRSVLLCPAAGAAEGPAGGAARTERS